MYEEYLNTIIQSEQRKIIRMIIDKFGESENFTYNILVTKFVTFKQVSLVDDNFNVLKKRGRPRKVS